MNMSTSFWTCWSLRKAGIISQKDQVAVEAHAQIARSVASLSEENAWKELALQSSLDFEDW